MANPVLSAVRVFQRKLIRVIQIVVIVVTLSVVYLVGLGTTWLVALAVAPRRGLGLRRAARRSWWIEAKGYDADAEACARQS